MSVTYNPHNGGSEIPNQTRAVVGSPEGRSAATAGPNVLVKVDQESPTAANAGNFSTYGDGASGLDAHLTTRFDEGGTTTWERPGQ